MKTKKKNSKLESYFSRNKNLVKSQHLNVIHKTRETLAIFEQAKMAQAHFNLIITRALSYATPNNLNRLLTQI